MNQQPPQPHNTMSFTIANNSAHSLSPALRQFLNNKKLADVTISVQSQVFYAHKLILAARSAYFANLIFVQYKDVPNLEIDVHSAKPDIFYSVLEFMYTDATSLKQQNVWDIYRAGKFYQISELMTVCEQFVISTIEEVNVFENWKNAQDCQCTDIAEHCVLYIINRFEDVIQQQNLKNISINDDPEKIKKLLKLNEKKDVEMKDTEPEISYNMLENYTFPVTKQEPLQQQNYFNPSMQPPINQIPQTLQMWSNDAVPPPAFPTPESIATFPKFFNVDKNKRQKLDTEDKKRVVCRRLSIISDPNSLGLVFQHIISCVTKLMDAERTSLFIYDRESDELCSQVAVGEHEIRIPSDKGIAGEVFKSGKQVNVKDCYSDSKFDSNIDKNTGFNTRSVLCSPLLASDASVMGVIEILNKKGGSFTKLDEQRLETIALLISLLMRDHLDEEGMSSMKGKVLLVHPSSIYNRKKSVQISKDVLSSFIMNDDSGQWLKDDLFSELLGNEEEGNDTAFGTSLGSTISSSNFDMMNNHQQKIPPPPNMPMNVNPNLMYQPMNHYSQVPMGMMMDTMNMYPPNVLPQQIPQQPMQNIPQQQPMYTQQFQMQPKQEPMQEEEDETKQRKKKRKRLENMPFMHFRIPRYELQFIQFDADGMKKKKK